jgi:structural maintenance of chromosome 1
LTLQKEAKSRISAKIDEYKKQMSQSKDVRARSQAELERESQKSKDIEKRLKEIAKELKTLAAVTASEEFQMQGKKLSDFNQLFAPGVFLLTFGRKEEARSRTFNLQQELSNLQQNLKLCHDKISALEKTVKENEVALESIDDKNKSVSEVHKKKEAELAAYQKNAAELSEKLQKSRRAAKVLESEDRDVSVLLEEQRMKLRDAKSDRKESERETEAHRALDGLMRLFPGVRGRLFDLCKPRKREYNVPITVAMGRFMDAVVVDTEAAALRCIEVSVAANYCADMSSI